MSEFNKDDYLNDLPDPSDAEAAARPLRPLQGLTPPPSLALRRIRLPRLLPMKERRGSCRS